MCKDYNCVEKILDNVSNLQLATLIVAFVSIFITAAMQGCVCERVSRIEAKLNMEAPPILKKKGE